jgi:hypothetical protein
MFIVVYYKSALGYAFRGVQEKQEGLKLFGTESVVVLLTAVYWAKTNAIRKGTEASYDV